LAEKELDLSRALGRRIRVSCRDYPSESGCTLTLSGTEEEVFRAALLHAIDAHGHKDTPEFREMIRDAIQNAPEIPK
jgi:spore coat polysaccharide biosynthesis protein SpsF (cytidylyltransferase family)